MPRPFVRTRFHQQALLGAGAVLTLLLAACGSASSPSTTGAGAAPSVPATGALLAAAKTPLGTILVDGKGNTVYMFAADSPGHSNCGGSCAKYWPPVPAPATLPSSLTGVTAAIAAITRADGVKQVTVAGMPVYTYAGDSAPGMTSGQGKNLSGGLWWVLSPSGQIIKAKAAASPAAVPGMGY